jgi:hypothetical protein
VVGRGRTVGMELVRPLHVLEEQRSTRTRAMLVDRKPRDTFRRACPRGRAVASRRRLRPPSTRSSRGRAAQIRAARRRLHLAVSARHRCHIGARRASARAAAHPRSAEPRRRRRLGAGVTARHRRPGERPVAHRLAPPVIGAARIRGAARHRPLAPPRAAPPPGSRSRGRWQRPRGAVQFRTALRRCPTHCHADEAAGHPEASDGDVKAEARPILMFRTMPCSPRAARSAAGVGVPPAAITTPPWTKPEVRR